MVDERWKRILQLWLWALAVAALVGVFVFVLAVAPSLLIGHPPKGLSAADELTARNNVRTTLVQALAGLAVAGGLVVTYRTYRQNRAEQDRTYERELYAKAVEQLGHEKAPVRLGALYSLERLAQDKSERRQTIVDVICAYLRMPFSPTAPARNPESEATGDRGERKTETETRTDESGSTWQQERQVRLTAQRILADHLRGGNAKPRLSTDPPSSPSPRFWPDIRLDLVGATLIDFNLEDGRIAEADFGGATFSGGAWFRGATFSGGAWFRGATFSGDAVFDGKATFSGDASFGGATFSGDARFDWAAFSGDAGFGGATFSGDAGFGGAAFSYGAMFRGATFRRDAKFDRATFSHGAWFSKAAFGGGAVFDKATFDGDSWSDGVSSSGFRGATFSGGEDSLSFELSRRPVTGPWTSLADGMVPRAGQ